jgi:multidrug efflux system membrane fusion protein
MHRQTKLRGASRVLVPLLAFTAITALTSGCRRDEPVRAEQIRPVKTSVVTATEATQTRLFSGRVVAAREADLAFRVSGLLASLPVREGQRVAKGDVVAVLRQDEFLARQNSLQGQLSQSEAVLRALRAGLRPEERLRLESQVRAADARLANAKAEFDRFSELIKENAVARTEFELRETQYRVAQEDVKSARQLFEQSAIGRQEDIEAQESDIAALRARLQEINIQLNDSTIRAPFDGVVAQRFVEESQDIAVGQPVLRIQASNELTVAIDVPEAVMASDIRSDDIIGLFAEFNAAPGRQFPVEIREVAQVADPVTQTFRVRAAMAAPEGLNLLPGMTASVRLTQRSLGPAGQIRVPITSIMRDTSGEPIAWILGEDRAVRRRAVRLGEIAGPNVEVVEGLKVGDRIAVAGVTQLKDGMIVRDLGDGLGARP